MTEVTNARRLRQLLLLLVLVLTFEGVARKAAPTSWGVPLFLLKDAIVSIIAYYVLLMPRVPALAFFWNAYKILAVLFVLPIVFTGWNDPLLAVFGAKQYLLFPFVGFATFLAFYKAGKETFLGFFRWLGLLVIPTTLLAVLQVKLPHDHWLNLSVGGETLEGFSAGGQLRVSSTFPFVAQYCAFLNAEVFIVAMALIRWRERSAVWKVFLLSLVPFLVIGSFITGSRGAVAGNTAIFLLATCFALIRFEMRYILRIGVILAILYLAVYLENLYLPDTTVAYAQRENGKLIGISSEVRERIFGSFFHYASDDSMRTFFGNGLGIMSNGSATFSNYAAKWRFYLWTETDFPTILFEGGYYLVVVWYGFRFFIIAVTASRFLRAVTGDYFIPGAITQAFVIIIGIVGTLSTQPPIAIWWWLGVGTSLLLWWKCISGFPEPEQDPEELPLPSPKIARGRSLYSEVLHTPKKTTSSLNKR